MRSITFLTSTVLQIWPINFHRFHVESKTTHFSIPGSPITVVLCIQSKKLEDTANIVFSLARIPTLCWASMALSSLFHSCISKRQLTSCINTSPTMVVAHHVSITLKQSRKHSVLRPSWKRCCLLTTSFLSSEQRLSLKTCKRWSVLQKPSSFVADRALPFTATETTGMCGRHGSAPIQGTK